MRRRCILYLMQWSWFNSISRRIRLGYYALVAVVALIMLLVGVGLANVRQRIYALEAASALMDTVLEIRRYEKNWLLYRKDQDFQENRKQLDKAMTLLRERNGGGVAAPAHTRDQLQQDLLRYRDLMESEFTFFQTEKHHANEEQIRSVGKRLVELAEVTNQHIRLSIEKTLSNLNTTGILLVLAVAGLALILGRQMATSVVLPLQRIVAYTRNIAEGRFTNWEESTDLVEIRAVAQAIRSMLEVLNKREKQLIQSEKLAAVGTLVAGVAHELNNPLSNAGTSAQILLEELQEADVRGKDFFVEMAKQIEEETDRARVIVRALLEFSRDKNVRPRDLNLGQFLNETSKLVRGDFPVSVDFEVVVKNDGVFLADKQRLQQALVNLLMNAAQALDGEGEIRLVAGIELQDNLVFFEVSDNGPGIPAADLEKIFDPFYTTKDVGEGSGLGLAVTREIIAKHNGEITVKSEEGNGASFVIRIPLRKLEKTEQENGETENFSGG